MGKRNIFMRVLYLYTSAFKEYWGELELIISWQYLHRQQCQWCLCAVSLYSSTSTNNTHQYRVYVNINVAKQQYSQPAIGCFWLTQARWKVASQLKFHCLSRLNPWCKELVSGRNQKDVGMGVKLLANEVQIQGMEVLLADKVYA